MTCQGNKFCGCLAGVRGASDGTKVSSGLSKLAPLETDALLFVLLSPHCSPLADGRLRRDGRGLPLRSLLPCGDERPWEVCQEVCSRRAQPEGALLRFCHSLISDLRDMTLNLLSAPPSFPPFLFSTSVFFECLSGVVSDEHAVENNTDTTDILVRGEQ